MDVSKKRKQTKLTELINPKTAGNEHMSYEETHDEEGNDIIGRREIKFDNKTEYELRLMDPYAFWKIVPKGGVTLPECLSGQYTSSAKAIQDIEAYLNKV